MTIARLAMRVWNTPMLNINTKIQRYRPESWPLYSDQDPRPNTFHLRNLRRILGMFALFGHVCMRSLGHARRVHYGRILKDILYGELATGSRAARKPVPLYKDVCKRDMRAGNIDATS